MKSKKKSQSQLDTCKSENTTLQIYRCSRNSFGREMYSDRGLPPETRKTSSKQPNLPSKGIIKRITNKAQNQKEGYIKDQIGNK